MDAVPPPDLPVTRNSATALQVERIGEGWLPALLAPDAERRVIEFFTAHIRNPHTRKAYPRATTDWFAAWAERHHIAHLHDVDPVHVTAYVERTRRPDGAARREANVREKAASRTRFSFQNCPGARYFAILRLKLEHSDTF